MKHSVEELINIVYTYFPRGLMGDEPHYQQTAEIRRQREAHARASGQYATWRALLRRLAQRFPSQQYPGVGVQNEALYLQDPQGTIWGRCFTASLWLPVRAPEERAPTLSFLVSFVVPYYVVFSSRNALTERADGTLDPQSATSFDLSPDEQPFATAIIEEIELAYPGYEPMPRDVGRIVIPDVVTERKGPGEATIFGCLFSDDW